MNYVIKNRGELLIITQRFTVFVLKGLLRFPLKAGEPLIVDICQLAVQPQPISEFVLRPQHCKSVVNYLVLKKRHRLI